jgi:prolyl-tRNA editing enzyme YbaK/EbsC (Cys-tRNA(Pro) deacylase)
MALRVTEVLGDVEYRVIELSDRAVTVDDVVEYSKEEITREEICKTILVKSKGEFYALFLRGPDKIDFKKLKKVIGKASIASFEEVKAVSGVEPGAVCPLLVSVPVIVDQKVVDLEMVNFGSGNHLFGVEMKTMDLNKVLEYRLEDISVD